jgi:elongation factor G
MPAVEQGIRDSLDAGPVGGYPVDDVHAALVDGSYHDADSRADAFRLASAIATSQALKNAAPVLLEPLLRIEATIAAEFDADVTAQLAKRPGQILARERRGTTRIVIAVVPAAAMLGYDVEFRSCTFGRGSYTLDFHGFAPVPPSDREGDELPASVPRRPVPKPRLSSTAVPEPEDDLL